MAADDFNSQWSGKQTQERMLALKRTTDAVFQGQDKPENDRASKEFRIFMEDAQLRLASTAVRAYPKTSYVHGKQLQYTAFTDYSRAAKVTK